MVFVSIDGETWLPCDFDALPEVVGEDDRPFWLDEGDGEGPKRVTLTDLGMGG